MNLFSTTSLNRCAKTSTVEQGFRNLYCLSLKNLFSVVVIKIPFGHSLRNYIDDTKEFDRLILHEAKCPLAFLKTKHAADTRWKR